MTEDSPVRPRLDVVRPDASPPTMPDPTAEHLASRLEGLEDAVGHLAPAVRELVRVVPLSSDRAMRAVVRAVAVVDAIEAGATR